VLKNLPPQAHPNLIIGTNQADDSGVVRVSEDVALVLTVDFFPAVVDDPYIFGQVAAANAMSDVYAMGGRPITALNIVIFPDRGLPMEVLSELLRGGADKVNEGGAVVVGGHTIKGTELTYGLSIVGLVDPRKILPIGGAKNGDILILTKPLGSGIYSTALKNGALSPRREKLFYRTMSALNHDAAEGLFDFGANACTDITGFGLLGHALEMATSSDVSIVINARALPLLPGAVRLSADGFLTGGGMANREYVKDELKIEGAMASAFEMLLYDPQTSGGLLVSIPRKKAERYLEALKQRRVAAAVIGEVEAPSDKRLIVKARSAPRSRVSPSPRGG
jgi:selenide,water dikinase